MSRSGGATGGPPSGAAGGELAGAYPNPTLAPAAVLARLESQFTGALQLVIGTGAGAGALASIANGYGITGFAANPPTPAVSLTTVTSFLTANVALTAATPANVLSPSLGIGTWVVTGAAQMFGGATAGGDQAAWFTTTTAGAATTSIGGAEIQAPAVNFGVSLSPSPFPLTLGAATTVFLVAESTTANWVVGSAGNLITTHTLTGVTAVRIG